MAPEKQPDLNSRVSTKIVRVLAVSALVALSLAILANSMTKPLSRDEHMYCTAGVLLAQGKMIYRDFSYAAQLPYHPLLYAAVFKMLNTSHYLLFGRVISAVCDILVMLCIVGIYRRLFRGLSPHGTLLGIAAAILYVFNPLVDYANGYAWNHDVVILCVLASVWLFVSCDFDRRASNWWIAAIGALLTFATCMRVTTALVELLFFAALLIQPAGSLGQRLRRSVPFLAATGIVLIWPVWVISQTPLAFILNLVRIPTLYGEWLHEIGMVHDKIGLTWVCLTTPGYSILIVALVCLWLSAVYLCSRSMVSDVHRILLPALLPLVFFIIAWIPPTMWRQYLAMPVPFLTVAAAPPLLLLRKHGGATSPGKHFRIACALLIVCVLVAVAAYPVVLYRTPAVMAPEIWVPVEVHKLSVDIAAQTKEPKLVLTLGPLFAIEGGGRIYEELSCGSVIYRIAGELSASERAVTHTVGPETLPELLKQNPPSAVILGVEPGPFAFLEEPLREHVKSDWRRKNYEGGLTVYVKP
ncbi:MAG: hypothetical protein JSU70_18960 [Phycisphaerales bacterium]|nr:MAG: hypothetical protein JSU70_18960 [Phycisphaerales bacterium]